MPGNNKTLPPPGHPILPKDHPRLEHQPVTSFTHPKSGAQSKLNIPAAVKEKWRAVKLGINAEGGKETAVRMPIGGAIRVEGTALKLHVVAFVPAFTSNARMITSVSNNPDNPAVLLRLQEGKKTLSEGWVFQNLTEFNTFSHGQVKVRLSTGLTAEELQ